MESLYDSGQQFTGRYTLNKRETIIMTKNEFLMQIENELKHLSSTVRNDVLNEYENHINEGMEDGGSEGAVVEALGDPADIAEEILSVEDVEEKDGEREY